jgi:nitroreductase
MNPVIENILSRRSIRSFTEEPLKESDLELIVEAARHAPSGMNRQTWQFTVLTNQEIIKELANAIAEVLDREGYCFYKPQALIIPSNKQDSAWGRDDNACALQNIFLSAHSLGIGSVWINQLCGICHNEKIRPILSKIGIPEDHIVYGLAALGYPKAEGKIHERQGVVKFIR